MHKKMTQNVQAAILLPMPPSITPLHFAFPWHTQWTIDKEAVKTESDVGLFFERFTLRGGPQLVQSCMERHRGLQGDIVCGQQYGLVT